MKNKSGNIKIRPFDVTLTVILTVFVCIMLLPLGYIIVRSFFSPEFSLNQYHELFVSDDGYYVIYLRSFLIALAITVGQFITSVFVSFLLSRFEFRGKRLLLLIYIMVFFIPGSAALLPNYIAVKFLGLVGTQLSVILPSVFSPVTVILMTIFFSTVPKETIEAALLETNNIFHILFYIVLPQCIPGAMLSVVITFTEAWSMVELPQTLLEDKLMHPLSLLVNDIFRGSGDNFASEFLYIIPVLMITFLFFRILKDKDL